MGCLPDWTAKARYCNARTYLAMKSSPNFIGLEEGFVEIAMKPVTFCFIP